MTLGYLRGMPPRYSVSAGRGGKGSFAKAVLITLQRRYAYITPRLIAMADRLKETGVQRLWKVSSPTSLTPSKLRLGAGYLTLPVHGPLLEFWSLSWSLFLGYFVAVVEMDTLHTIFTTTN